MHRRRKQNLPVSVQLLLFLRFLQPQLNAYRDRQRVQYHIVASMHFPRQNTENGISRGKVCAKRDKTKVVAVVTSQFINLIEFLRDLLHLSNPRRFSLPI